MALNFGTVPSYYAKPNQFLVPKQKHHFLHPSSPSLVVAALSQGTEGRGVAEEDPRTSSGSRLDIGPSSTRAQLDLLEQLTSAAGSPVNGYESDGYSSPGTNFTIRDQLAGLAGERDDDFVVQLGKENLKKISAKFLTVSQKRNIKRQSYLDEVSERNDSIFFATIGAFVILPPVIILGIAIATGYVQLFP